MRQDRRDTASQAAKPRRWRWLLPALVALAWLAIGGFSGPFVGKLSDVTVNDSSAFLPASAESTEVADLAAEFTDRRTIPAILVAARDGDLTAADQKYLADRRDEIAELPDVDDELPPALPADDRDAARLVLPIGDDADPGEVVERVRELADTGQPEGLNVLVTGPAAQVADLGAAFAGIDGLLLLVAGIVVAIILVLVYRSPLLPLIVLASAVFALGVASLAVYYLADNQTLDLDGESQGILFILVFGAATDYALLLVSRFREELRRTTDRFTAVRRAWRATIEPITASAGTVILGVLCLLFSDLNSNRTLGPVAAIGIGAALLASVTFLPAMLALTGRAAFWPSRPAVAGEPLRPARSWRLISRVINARPRLVWVLSCLVLLIGAGFAPQLRAEGTAQSDVFLNPVDSVAGQEMLAEHFDAGTGNPTVVITGADSADRILDAVRVEGVAEANVAVDPDNPADGPHVVDDKVKIDVVLDDPADSESAIATVQRIRKAVDGEAKVGGPTAVQLDTQNTSRHDRALIIPIVLAVILLVLIVLLRSLVAPLLLIATVVLSFAATMGVSALVFNHVLGFPGADPVVPLFGFVFLVALGIDYNIFLMTRVREEVGRRGNRAGTLHGLTVTGGVITSAGVVLAATFSALAVLPILFLAQIAFIVAFGVLLDTMLVRSLLVPALTIDIGRRSWWPSRLVKQARDPDAEPDRNPLHQNSTSSVIGN